jgi:hypothetical protein
MVNTSLHRKRRALKQVRATCSFHSRTVGAGISGTTTRAFTMSSYDADAAERRSVKRGAFWFVVFIAGSFALAYTYRLFMGPFKAAHKKRTLEYEKAALDLATPTCADPVLRAQLEGYNNCERSRLITEDSVIGLAVHDVLTELKFCKQGVCIVPFFEVNVTELIWPLFRVLAPLALVLYLFSILGLITWRHGHVTGMYQLPMAQYDPVLVQAALEHQHRLMSKQQCESPPPRSKQD